MLAEQRQRDAFPFLRERSAGRGPFRTPVPIAGAAAYLLDRQETAWSYQHICRQAAKNRIALKAAGDIDGFASLLEDVVDRARGRIKKALSKLLEPGRGSRPRTGGPEC